MLRGYEPKKIKSTKEQKYCNISVRCSCNESPTIIHPSTKKSIGLQPWTPPKNLLCFQSNLVLWFDDRYDFRNKFWPREEKRFKDTGKNVNILKKEKSTMFMFFFFFALYNSGIFYRCQKWICARFGTTIKNPNDSRKKYKYGKTSCQWLRWVLG